MTPWQIAIANLETINRLPYKTHCTGCGVPLDPPLRYVDPDANRFCTELCGTRYRNEWRRRMRADELEDAANGIV